MAKKNSGKRNVLLPFTCAFLLSLGIFLVTYYHNGDGATEKSGKGEVLSIHPKTSLDERKRRLKNEDSSIQSLYGNFSSYAFSTLNAFDFPKPMNFTHRQLLEEPVFVPYGEQAPDGLENFPCSFRADDQASMCSVKCNNPDTCESAKKWCAVTTECDAIIQVSPYMAVLRRKAVTFEDKQALRESLQQAQERWGDKLSSEVKRRSYLITSYGGSGSKMLCGLIAMAPNKRINYIWHVHDPVPSQSKLFAPLKHPNLRRTNIRPGQDFRSIQFMDTDLNNKQRMVEIPANGIDDFRFVFLFRNPIEAMLSRYFYGHCKNLKGDCGTDKTFPSYLKYAKESGDRMRLEEHYDNYITKNSNRQYPIIAINYHRMWDDLEDILDILGLPRDLKSKFPKRAEKRRSTDATIGDATVEELVDHFSVKFSSLVKKVKSMPAVMII